MGAAKMRLSIFCIRDDFPIFYIVCFLFSSVLVTLSVGVSFACGKPEFYSSSLVMNIMMNASSSKMEETRIALSWKYLIHWFPMIAPQIKQRMMP